MEKNCIEHVAQWIDSKLYGEAKYTYTIVQQMKELTIKMSRIKWRFKWVELSDDLN